MIACTPIYRHSFLHLLYNIFSLKIITLREIRHRFCVTKDVPCVRVDDLFAVAF